MNMAIRVCAQVCRCVRMLLALPLGGRDSDPSGNSMGSAQILAVP